MTGTKLELLTRIVESAGPNALRSKRSRKELGKRIAEEVSLWQPAVESFMEEMAGLNFYNAEDRLLFLQFAERAL